MWHVKAFALYYWSVGLCTTLLFIYVALLCPTTTYPNWNACSYRLWKSGWNLGSLVKTGHKIKKRTLIAIRSIVSYLYGYWVVPLAVWWRRSSHSQDATALTGAAVASSGNYLLTMFISLGWQSCYSWVWLKGRDHFLQPKTALLQGWGFCPSCDLFHVFFFTCFLPFRWCENCQRSRWGMSCRQPPSH